MRLFALLAAAASCAVLAGAAEAKPEIRFYAYYLGTSSASAINNAGQVVGVDDEGAFITGPKAQGKTYLGTFGLYAIPYDVNDEGVVVGHSGGKAFITDPGGLNMREIVMPGDSVNTKAVAVNAAGQVVGQYYAPSATDPHGYDYHGFITDPGGVDARRLDGFNPDNTTLSGINSLGQVSGYSSVGGHTRGFVTGPNGVGLTEVDPAGAAWVTVGAINDAGQYGGLAASPPHDPSSYHTFVARPGQAIEFKNNLGGWNASFQAMNRHGDQVGMSSRPNGDQKAYVSMLNGRLVQIDKYAVGLRPGTNLTMAFDINDKRQMVVSGTGGSYLVCVVEGCW